MEGVRCCQWDTVESLRLKGGHHGLNGCCLTSNHRHFRRVFVGGNHVPFCFIEDGFHLLIRSGYAGHEAFIVNLHRAHFSTSSRCCTQGAVHVKNTRGHQSSVFTQRVSCHHVWMMPVGVESAFDCQVCCEHGRLCVFSLLQFMLCFLAFISA